METPEQDITRLLHRIRDGDQAAGPELLEVAYGELRRIAGSLFRDQPGDHTLQPTALVNEVCARFLGAGAFDWKDRQHFVRAAAKAMRHLLADHARAKGAERRGGGMTRVSLDGAQAQAPGAAPIDLMALDEAVTRLASRDERLGQVFELRFLAGLTVAEAAYVAGVSERTIEMDTRFIRAWLQKELGP